MKLGQTAYDYLKDEVSTRISLAKAKKKKDVIDKLFKTKEDKFKNFLLQAKEIIENIAVYKKEGNSKEIQKYHEKLDNLLHGFVGEKNLTPEEKKVGL